MAQEYNEFDLEGRDGGPDRAKRARTWTQAEQEEKLSGYLEVDPEFWAQIRYGTHIRYYSSKGEFRPGGFVLKNPLDSKPQGSGVEKRFIKIQNGFNEKARDYACWMVPYEDLSRVFVKPDAAALMLLKVLKQAVAGLNENIRKVAEVSNNHGARIRALEKSD